MKKDKKDEFLICAIREADKESIERTEKYVEEVESQGIKLHYPRRDTNQNDPVGLRICTDNMIAIIPKKKVRVRWDKNSKGSHFDFGGTFAISTLFSKERSLWWRIKTITKLFFMGKKIIILVNPDEVEQTDDTDGKSFNKVLLALHEMNIKRGKR